MVVKPKKYPNSAPSSSQDFGLFCGGKRILPDCKISRYTGILSQDERCRDAKHMYTLRDGTGYYLNGKNTTLAIFNARRRTHSVAMFADDPWPAGSSDANARWVHTLDTSRYPGPDGEIVTMNITVWLQARCAIEPGDEITVALGRIQHGFILDELSHS